MPGLAKQAGIALAAPKQGLFPKVVQMMALARQRRMLRNLDIRLLDDIGVDADAARQEAQRPAWDVPANWRK